MMYFSMGRIQSVPETSKGHPGFLGFLVNARTPTDPFFYAPLTLQNIVVGSQYWIAQASNLSNVLATGTAASSTEVIEDVPAYSNPMLVVIRVRKGTSGVRYWPLETYGYIVKGGTDVWISQVADGVLNG